MKLIIVRHGETKENKAEIIQGNSIGGTLTKKGIEQAKKLGLRLRDENINIAYISDLDRTVQTAKEILMFHPETDIIYTKELRERNDGVFEGYHVSKYKESRKKSNLSFGHFRPEKGESVHDAQARIKNLYHELVEKHPKETVLLVSHGALITSLLLYLLGKSINLKSFLKHLPVNTAITVLEIDDNKKHKVHVLNCAKHLD